MSSPRIRGLIAAVGDGDGDLGGDAGVVLRQREVGRDAAAVGRLGDAAQHERRDRRAGDAGGVTVGEGLIERRGQLAWVEFGVLWNRHGQQHARRRPRRRRVDAGDLVGRLDPVRRLQTRRPGVERREPVVLPAEHRHPDRLEVLERPGEVEKGLRPGTHRDHVMMGEGVEVGGDVAGELRTAMDAADAAGGEHRDAGGGGDRHRGRHRRGAELPALGDRHRDVALGHLAGRSEDAADLAVVQSDPHRPVEDGRDCRYRAAVTDRRRTAVERLAVGRRRQAEVGEDRRLERDDRPSFGERRRDFVGTGRRDHGRSLPSPGMSARGQTPADMLTSVWV